MGTNESSHSSPWHLPNIFHFNLFSNNNNRKQNYLSSNQMSFVNAQKKAIILVYFHKYLAFFLYILRAIQKGSCFLGAHI